MDKETEGLVERHREAAFQNGFVTGFVLAVIGAGVGIGLFWFVEIVFKVTK